MTTEISPPEVKPEVKVRDEEIVKPKKLPLPKPVMRTALDDLGSEPIVEPEEEPMEKEQGEFNTLGLRQNGCHFAGDIFKCICLNENVVCFD